ncbi:hypothetical protein R2R35_08905 [Anaerocolumna sp. AGMB13020]|nr:hypothetical protein [Anaerocolumna sp. AGMB13020]WOO38607.1 hypothetical protein R2R35_08905 [Anaerocolumna sp. AGMB13020]
MNEKLINVTKGRQRKNPGGYLPVFCCLISKLQIIREAANVD